MPVSGSLAADTKGTMRGGPAAPAISLRPFGPAEVEAAVAWMMDDRVGRHMRWDTCKTREEAVALLAHDILARSWCRVGYADGDRPVGFIYAQMQPGAGACRAKIGCVVAPECWSRGIGSEMTRMAAQEVFRLWPAMERIEAMVTAGNHASERTLRKAGFRQEAVLRRHVLKGGKAVDKVLYSLLRPRPRI